VHFPLVTATHWAGISSRWGEPWGPGDAVRDPLPDSPTVDDWPDLSEPVRGGNLRAELRRIALGQGLAGDAAFVVITAADITSISDRRYRELQLAAGLVEGRLHLAAYALDYGASGMSFVDSEIPGLLQEGLEAMIFTCVGVPEYANTPGGPPGEPVLVRQVVPRFDE
jgi:hypothetical protein